jgi:hypothetical protein
MRRFQFLRIVAATTVGVFMNTWGLDGARAANLPALRNEDIIARPTGIIPLRLTPGGGWLAGVTDPDPDSNESDLSAWQVFIAINALAPSQQQVGPSAVSTNNAIWETWADDALTFPGSPDLAHPPQWPASATTFPLKRLRIPEQNRIRLLLRNQPTPAARALVLKNPKIAHPMLRLDELFSIDPKRAPKGATPEILLVQMGGGEEVRRNKASFDFIVGQNLWYTQGLAAAFTAGAPIVFPVNAIEIKARWIPIVESQKPQFHWNYDSTGKLYGLVALHIMTKALPNWLWATWEWTGNAGRCDYIGCHDSFGVAPANVAPQTPLGGPYPSGTLATTLLAKFSAAGLGAEWQNYRLKGSQTLFADTTGLPTLLGNSVTENGFVQTSSCITCHGQASVDKSGHPNPSVGFVGNQSSNGPLRPSMFYTTTSPPVLEYLPIDFIWGILAASPAP